ncbi:hypothetical protein ACS8FA_14830, partial [Psychrobacter sp. 1Y1]|uniref:hypothetical protein n=1 Tax=Psychrobacter sp. 1Y1 TaxID=3453574 RepID=UPI003F48F7BA
YLATELATIEGFEVDMSQVQTNMVFAVVSDKIDTKTLALDLKAKGILLSPGKTIRFVTHADISRADITHFISELKGLLSRV